MPFTGKLQINPGTADNPDGGYRFPDSATTPKYHPGYTKCLLARAIRSKCSWQQPERTIHKYTYPADQKKQLILRPQLHGIYNYDGKVFMGKTNRWVIPINYIYFCRSPSQRCTRPEKSQLSRWFSGVSIQQKGFRGSEGVKLFLFRVQRRRSAPLPKSKEAALSAVEDEPRRSKKTCKQRLPVNRLTRPPGNEWEMGREHCPSSMQRSSNDQLSHALHIFVPYDVNRPVYGCGQEYRGSTTTSTRPRLYKLYRIFSAGYVPGFTSAVL